MEAGRDGREGDREERERAEQFYFEENAREQKQMNFFVVIIIKLYVINNMKSLLWGRVLSLVCETD